ncbi:MAG: hypothetical protein AAF329_18130 [Cyanobacteria bacterium P01_A01_bin.17]
MSLQHKLFLQSPEGRFVAYSQRLDRGQTLRLQFAAHSKLNLRLTWQQVLDFWQNDSDFRDLTTNVFVQSPYAAFFWETPPITRRTRLKVWECVIVNAPALTGVVANPLPFSQQFERQESGTEICLFPNLGGDALLVVPCPAKPLSTHAHLAVFVRNAPHPRTDILWQSLSEAISYHLETSNGEPLWISTSGLGVSWLHIRLDSFPKYYTHRPYRYVS